MRYTFPALFMGLTLGLIGIYMLTAQEARSTSPSTGDESISLSRLLDELGSKYGYFFTLEETWKDAESMNRLESHRVQRSARGQDIWQELDSLRKVVPGLTYKVDKTSPQIIHVMDEGLAQQKEYALDRLIPSIDFTGTVFNLVKAIAKKGVRVSSRGAIDFREISSMDFKTQIHVRGKRLSVRRALSDFVPLEGRNSRILWVARTKIGPNEPSYIQFRLHPESSKGRED